jgi:hypothetical protein
MLRLQVCEITEEDEDVQNVPVGAHRSDDRRRCNVPCLGECSDGKGHPLGHVGRSPGRLGHRRMLVFHNMPMTNAEPPCNLLTNGYIVNESQTGHDLFNTMLLTALLNRREVQFVILGCFENRPQIVSVSIR